MIIRFLWQKRKQLPYVYRSWPVRLHVRQDSLAIYHSSLRFPLQNRNIRGHKLKATL